MWSFPAAVPYTAAAAGTGRIWGAAGRGCQNPKSPKRRPARRPGAGPRAATGGVRPRPGPARLGHRDFGRGRLEVPRADGTVCVSPREELAMRLDLTEARVQVSASGGTGTGASLGGAQGTGGPAPPAPPGPSQRSTNPRVIKTQGSRFCC